MIVPKIRTSRTLACSEEYIDFICSQLKGLGVIRTRKMFGDWCIYVDEKTVILACDELCYVKMRPAIADMMCDEQTGYPYDGAKLHYILDIENRDIASPVIMKLVEVLPYPICSMTGDEASPAPK